MTVVRTRFAPSPTGPLHLGGARTALFNWLFARQQQGKFILRVEDSDRERSAQQWTDAIIEGLTWLGLNWDERPYFQSQRSDIYQDHLDRLLEAGKAYRCYCSPEELEAKRKAALAARRKPKYDGTCRSRGGKVPGRRAAIRFRTSDVGQTIVPDMVKGAVSFDNSELDDLIIARSDGTPTYNFCVVVDDVTMSITHVIRGDDHLNNTPRQIQLYQAFGYPIPHFAHIPLILGPDKARLSKRHGATSLLAYRDQGYLPEAMVNFLARLAWSYGDQEIFSADELVDKFRLEEVGKSAGVFNAEKLLWLNGHYIRQSDNIQLIKLLTPFLNERGYSTDRPDWLEKVVQTLKERAKTLKEMADQGEFYFLEKIDYQPKAAEKFLKPQMLQPFNDLVKKLGRLPVFTKENIETVMKEVAQEHNLKFAHLAQPVRVALTGGTVSPPIFDIIEVLEKRKTILRLNESINFINQKEVNAEV